MIKILIAVPTDAFIFPESFKSIYDLDIPEGVSCDFDYIRGRDIDNMRNEIAEKTLKEYDYLFSVDSDIILPKDALTKLYNHDLDLVTGIYIQRNEKNLTELYVRDSTGSQVNIPAEELTKGNLIEISATGFGCVLIKKKVFESMENPYFYYSAQQDFSRSVSEDVYFCNKIKSTKLYADTSVICKHLGKTIFEIKDRPTKK